MMKSLYQGIVCLFLIGGSGVAMSLETVEEARITLAQAALPEVLNQLAPQLDLLRNRLADIVTKAELHEVVRDAGQGLWLSARQQVDAGRTYDDRSLYWNRLKATYLLRNYAPDFDLTETQRMHVIEEFELASRGYDDLVYSGTSDLQIFITGFDPFHLDRRIAQSNPSGVAVLKLSGRTIQQGGLRAEIRGVTIPVRYTDFDDGEIEALLNQVYDEDVVDMLVTISMGRNQFDLERFPGRRRSSSALGNLNEHTGASEMKPQIPLLEGRPLAGPEFVEFSLPAAAMTRAAGAYTVRDNRKVATLEGAMSAASLAELADHIAVRGSGGGYLSNEISYRSIRLRNELGSGIPTGHIHTPSISEFSAEDLKQVVDQIEAMLAQALPVL
jgi:pyrrolidone-carboxylate peptidase